MEDLERLLREHDFLKDLSPEGIRVLVGCAKNLRFEPGRLLLREGEDADVFYLVREGRVALELHVPGRGDVRMETLGPGDVVGLSWLFPPAKVHLDARAVVPTIALAFDAACLRRKMAEDHDLGYALTRRLLAAAYQRLQRVRLQRVDVYAAEG